MARVRRITMLAAVYLLLGSVVSVAVAWGFAAQFPWTYWGVEVGPKSNVPAPDVPVPRWVLEAFDIGNANLDRFTRIDIVAFGFTSAECEAWRTPMAASEEVDDNWASLVGRPKPIDLTGMVASHTFAYGWPLRAMVRHEYRHYAPPWLEPQREFLGMNTTAWVHWNDESPAVLRGGWYVFDLPNGAYPYPVRLPLRPLWLGMAANSIFYGAIIAALVATPGLIRRAIRAKRVRAGLCPSCRYPRGVAAVCSECGEKLSA